MKKNKNPFTRLLKLYMSGQIAEDVWRSFTSKLDRKGITQEERIALVHSFTANRPW